MPSAFLTRFWAEKLKNQTKVQSTLVFPDMIGKVNEIRIHEFCLELYSDLRLENHMASAIVLAICKKIVLYGHRYWFYCKPECNVYFWLFYIIFTQIILLIVLLCRKIVLFGHWYWWYRMLLQTRMECLLLERNQRMFRARIPWSMSNWAIFCLQFHFQEHRMQLLQKLCLWSNKRYDWKGGNLDFTL